MDIRKATAEDLPRLLEIYARARAFMTEQGNPHQWAARNWPSEARVREDVDKGSSYVCREAGHILGVFVLEVGYRVEPTYDTIAEGAWIGGDTYGVVHRIASSGEMPGVGSFCIRWALRQCGHLRIDTHRDNLPMQGLLHKLGFTRCGTIFIGENRDPRIAFERIEE